MIALADTLADDGGFPPTEHERTLVGALIVAALQCEPSRDFLARRLGEAYGELEVVRRADDLPDLHA